MASAAIHLQDFEREAINRHLLALPIFNVTGLSFAGATFISGGKNVQLKRFEEKLAVQLNDAEQLTYFGSFPPVLERVVDSAKESGSGLESLALVYGLEGLHEETSAVFWTGFGQSETTAFVTTSPAAERPRASGQATMLNTVAVVDQIDQQLTCGEEGEIVIRG